MLRILKYPRANFPVRGRPRARQSGSSFTSGRLPLLRALSAALVTTAFLTLWAAVWLVLELLLHEDGLVPVTPERLSCLLSINRVRQDDVSNVILPLFA
jgi:hypothetical protein